MVRPVQSRAGEEEGGETMSKSAGVLAGLLIPAIFVAGAVAVPAMAQEKKAAQRTQKVFIDNDKVRVTDTTFKPGQVSPSIERPYRITRVLKGGTTVRTYADGTTRTVEFKTGDVFAAGPDKPYSSKNISKSDIVLYSVNLKKAKGMATMSKPQATPPDPKKATVNVRLENSAVRVYEARIPAGAEGANIPRPYRIARALQGATIQRTYADGKTETTVWKTGEVKELGPDRQFKPKNIGKTDFLLYVVDIK
jgi:quercetin dioxygenase-like cupin family protein